MRLFACASGALLLCGCGSEVRQPPTVQDPFVIDRLAQPASQVDVLLVVDNSISMAEKQGLLAQVVPELVQRLPTGDVHVGIISSSLGALTAQQCDNLGFGDPSNNDRGRLLSRTPSGAAETFEGKGFLAWSPGTTEEEEAAASATLAEMVLGVGEVGCGYEMPLEAMVRFLVDPAPYESLVSSASYLEKQGIDSVVLQQRSDFLRPDSQVLVLLFSDENDCSVDVSGQGFLTLEPAPFFRATSACESDPNDACCTSCGLPVPDGCSPDPACNSPVYEPQEDHPNLRCFDQKRRYGVSFLYPVERYANALTAPQIDPATSDLAGSVVQNPLLAGRAPGRVLFASVVGVPWQAVALGSPPDLAQGIKPATELDFDFLAGDPDANISPGDPFMIESVTKRSGTSPTMGYALPGDNPANGRDRTIAGDDSLQYACIFPLRAPVASSFHCDGCVGPACDDPICSGTTQVATAAYPGLRALSLVHALGDDGVAASICPQQVDDPNALDYGYRPVVEALGQKLDQRLETSCAPWQLSVDEQGRTPCTVLEASYQSPCSCDATTGRAPVDDELAETIASLPENPGWTCVCEVVQLSGNELDLCQNSVDPPPGVDGWCYVDATVSPPVGAPELVAHCPAQDARTVRLVGNAKAAQGATVLIGCSGE